MNLVSPIGYWAISGISLLIAFCVYWLVAHGQYSPRLSVDGRFYAGRDGSMILIAQVPLSRVSRLVQDENLQLSVRLTESAEQQNVTGTVLSITSASTRSKGSQSPTRDITVGISPGEVTRARLVSAEPYELALILETRRLAYLMPGSNAQEASN